jgi:hypothetical protein
MVIKQALYHIGDKPLEHLQKIVTNGKYERVIEFINKHDSIENVNALDMFKGKSDAGEEMFLMQLVFNTREDVLNITIRNEEMVAIT